MDACQRRIALIPPPRTGRVFPLPLIKSCSTRGNRSWCLITTKPPKEKRGMTDIYIELGGKKVIAWSLEWPGWCRIPTAHEPPFQPLTATDPPYRLTAQLAHLELSPR